MVGAVRKETSRTVNLPLNLNKKMETKKYRLPKEFTEKWLKALRSGEYKQGEAKLFNKRNDSYCCLGVACSVAKINPQKFVDWGWIHFSFANEEMPTELVEEKKSDGLPDELSRMNDQGKSFIEIADWIQKNVELY